MKRLRTFYAKLPVKKGRETVLQDVEVDIFKLEDENGVSLGEHLAQMTDDIKKAMAGIEKQRERFSKFIALLKGGKTNA